VATQTKSPGEEQVLVTFTTEAYADITMFGSAATSLLKMMGQSGNVPGALMAEDIAGALEQLRQSLDEVSSGSSDEAAAEADEQDMTRSADDDDAPPVSIATRAMPLVQLLEAAHAAQANVRWNH